MIFDKYSFAGLIAFFKKIITLILRSVSARARWPLSVPEMELMQQYFCCVWHLEKGVLGIEARHALLSVLFRFFVFVFCSS